MLGVVFLVVFMLAPETGMLSVFYREKQQKIEVMLLTFLLHLKNHNEKEERHVNHLTEHINWQKVKAKEVLELAMKNNMISIDKEIVSLTKKGNKFTTTAIDYITDNRGEAIEEMKEDFFLFRG